jgi:hypothetical protein
VACIAFAAPEKLSEAQRRLHPGAQEDMCPHAPYGFRRQAMAETLTGELPFRLYCVIRIDVIWPSTDLSPVAKYWTLAVTPSRSVQGSIFLFGGKFAALNRI